MDLREAGIDPRQSINAVVALIPQTHCPARVDNTAMAGGYEAGS
jgi:hypothetical protein